MLVLLATYLECWLRLQTITSGANSLEIGIGARLSPSEPSPLPLPARIVLLLQACNAGAAAAVAASANAFGMILRFGQWLLRRSLARTNKSSGAESIRGCSFVRSSVFVCVCATGPLNGQTAHAQWQQLT